MSLPMVVEVLYEAHKARATGRVTVTANGVDSQLLVVHGDVVGSSIGIGYQSVPQSLLQAGRLDLSQLDALWARGEFGPLDDESLNELKVPAADARTLHLLSNVKQLVARAESARFEEAEVDPALAVCEVDGAHVVRASLKVDPSELEGLWLRCPDLEACSHWLWTAEDGTFLETFREFRTALGASAAQAALLRLLQREGSLEQMTDQQWRAQQTQMSGAAPAESPPSETGSSPPWTYTPLQFAPALDDPGAEPTTEPTEIPNLARPAPAAQTIEPSWAAAFADAAGLHLHPPEEVTSGLSAVPPPEEEPTAAAPPPQPSALAEPTISASTIDLGDEEAASPGLGAAPLEPGDAWQVEGLEPPAQDFPDLDVDVDVDVEPPGSTSEPSDELTASAWPVGDSQGEEEEGPMSKPNDSEAARRRQRLLRRAMDNIGAFGQRPSSPREQADPVEAAAAVEAVSPTGLSAEEEQLARQIDARYQAIVEKRDHFSMLGIGREVTPAEVKTAYLNLVKVFHPDRLPAALAAWSEKMTAVFEAVREAYEVLHDAARRHAYARSLDHGQLSARPGEAVPPQAPADLFHMGEVFLRKRDFRRAEQHFMLAHQKQPQAEYLASAAWAIYMDPARREEGSKARQMMNEALKLNARCDRAHYQLGVIARVEGDMARAEHHFREAVQANPRHLEANQELRLLEMRKRKDKKEKKGLLG